MITIEVGVTGAMVSRFDRNAGTVWDTLEGERLVELALPEGRPLTESISNVVGSLSQMVSPLGTIWWIEASDAKLRSALCDHYHIGRKKRPARWGDGSTIEAALIAAGKK